MFLAGGWGKVGVRTMLGTIFLISNRNIRYQKLNNSEWRSHTHNKLYLSLHLMTSSSQPSIVLYAEGIFKESEWIKVNKKYQDVRFS
jgi:tetrahydromethanopterin S-methyltransferase subunit A